MSNHEIITDPRNVAKFRFLDLCDSTNWVDLVIKSGEREQLLITGPAQLVSRIRTKVENDTLVISLGGTLLDKIRDALTTSLSRKHIWHELTVQELEAVDLCGLIRVDTSGLETGQPVIQHLNPLSISIPVPPSGSRVSGFRWK